MVAGAFRQDGPDATHDHIAQKQTGANEVKDFKVSAHPTRTSPSALLTARGPLPRAHGAHPTIARQQRPRLLPPTRQPRPL